MEHWKHVAKVLQSLHQAGLQVDIAKCKFEVTEVKFFGLIISTQGVKMDPAKLEANSNWPAPQNVKDV